MVGLGHQLAADAAAVALLGGLGTASLDPATGTVNLANSVVSHSTANGTGLRGGGLVALSSVLATSVKLPVHNATSQRVTLTVAPVACVNAVTGLNGKQLGAGAWHTGRVTLARSGDIVDGYAWDGSHGITPAYADGLLNEQVRGLLYSTLNTYLSDGKAHDATYERVKKLLSPSPRTPCSRAPRAFAVGVIPERGTWRRC